MSTTILIDNVRVNEKNEMNKKREECDECAICMERLDENKNFARTNCKHSFCLTCLVRALKDNNTCPLCRTNIEDEKPTRTTKLDYREGLELVKDEIATFPLSTHLDTIMYVSRNPKRAIKHMLEVFGTELVRGIISHQNNYEGGYESDSSSGSSSEEEDIDEVGDNDSLENFIDE